MLQKKKNSVICKQFCSNVRLRAWIWMLQDEKEGIEGDTEQLTTLALKSESSAAVKLKDVRQKNLTGMFAINRIVPTYFELYGF